MIKASVLLFGIKPEMAIVHSEVKSIFANYGYGCVITSGVDSHAGKLSLHNEGLALDYRTKHIPDDVCNRMVNEIKTALPCCDIGLHSRSTPNEHLHVEFDPKNDKVFQFKKAAWKSGEQKGIK